MQKNNSQVIRVVAQRRAPPQSKNAKNKTKRKRKGAIPGPRKMIPLTACAHDYYRALTDPFGYTSPTLPCIPDLLDIPSYKFSTKIRGVFAAGTQGVGYVRVNPRAFANDFQKGTSTTSAFTGTTVLPTFGTGVVQVFDTNFPWVSTQTRGTRLVACGVRARYLGTELNKGGRLAIAHFPGASLSDGASVTTLLSKPTADSISIDRNWHGTFFRPMLSSQADYSDVAGFSESQLLIMVDTTASNNFEFEIMSYFESVPDDKAGVPYGVPNQTVSHSDVYGLSAIRNVIGELRDAAMGSGVYSAGLDLMRMYMAARNNPYGLPQTYNLEF